jgi:hypothetical protein
MEIVIRLALCWLRRRVVGDGSRNAVITAERRRPTAEALNKL